VLFFLYFVKFKVTLRVVCAIVLLSLIFTNCRVNRVLITELNDLIFVRVAPTRGLGIRPSNTYGRYGLLNLWRPLLPYGYSCKAFCARPG